MQLKKGFFQSGSPIAYLGTGEVGGKARGLEFIQSVLTTRLAPDQFPEFEVSIPRMIVIKTDVFDEFMDSNSLWLTALSNQPDEKIALAFQQADLPFHILGDLRLVVTEIRQPLAVRSSSLLEDAMHEPFAGVYRTKMTPNNAPDVDVRFRKLVEAIKYVYASTFFKSAKNYLRVTKHREDQEKMAVIIQEVIGKEYGERFYPEISGVACSYNFYPPGGSDPNDGVVNLALGLGKTIVDGRMAWSFSPAFPAKDPPFKSIMSMLRETQLKFWAVNLGSPPAYDPVRETEYLAEHHFTEAQQDGALKKLVSTYDPQNERVMIGQREGGALILTFSPILKLSDIPLNSLVKQLMEICEETFRTPVEIEFAVTLSEGVPGARHRFGFLQVRPLLVSTSMVDLTGQEMSGDQVVISSDMVLGNGQVEGIRDVVFVKSRHFDAREAHLIAAELEEINRSLVDARRPYLLIGYGRWGTTDPWAGIPVEWSQISGAKVIVEAASEQMNQDMSQGSHFFHNVTSFQVFYFSIPYPARFVFNMEWISQLPAVRETDHIRHAVADPPLTVKADGKTGRGTILRNLNARGTEASNGGGGRPHQTLPVQPRQTTQVMMNKSLVPDNLINQLQERAKELNCLYEIQELLSDKNKNTIDILKGIIEVIPHGWQYPDICIARISYRKLVVQSPGFRETEWSLESDIKAHEEILGKLQVFYTEERPVCDEGPFLKEEKKLIRSITELISSYSLHKQLKSVFEDNLQKSREKQFQWVAILDILKKTDPKLLIRISQKMVNYLCWKGITESERLFELFSTDSKEGPDSLKDINFPYQARSMTDLITSSNAIFELASKYLSETEMIDNISRWIKEDQSGFLVNTLNNTGSSFEEISAALARYHHLKAHGLELSPNREKSLRVILIRRLLSGQTEFIKTAKNFIGLDDFHDLVNHVIHPVDSHGKLGGKSSGLFLSRQILNKSKLSDAYAKRFLIPKTWYLTSDGILKFIKYNNLEDIVEQKYKDIEQIRKEYPFVSLVFKNSSFPSEIIKSLSLMLDNLAEVPLVIRSTSLLEDRPDSIFAGKYKSLFISNQGTKKERLEELTDAIAEVYASTFGPDPIEYRIEKDLLDYNEEMGIMIQEVVGRKVGPYYFPAFAGVAFSDNNYKWSGRIEKEDGLIRLVPGLGTRAVDRLSDDYPVLIAPGKPGLRVNVTIEDIVRYSPKKIDVINLEKRRLETIDIRELLRQYGREYPVIQQVVSRISEHHIQQAPRVGMNFDKDNYIVTFNGLIENSDFIPKIRSIMSVLQKEFKYPVDIEFAHDGQDFYLLQCRPQGYGKEDKPADLPYDLPEEDLIFTAKKHVTNGLVPNISHLVYIDPQKYSELPEYADLIAVGKAVGRLNKILPKRQFILMGPGRWGSRGDIKLGVNVTYSDINNTAMLIEIARKQKEYVPELSFGTHFFQDLVEANIRYLPLYPDEAGNFFNESFFQQSPNILPELFPDLSDLSDTIKVIDVSAYTCGRIINVLMNADENKAVALLAEPADPPQEKENREANRSRKNTDFFWRWRMGAAEQIASRLDPDRFGVQGIYIFGSTKNATAGLASDIDLIIHFSGSEAQRRELLLWLEGWGNSLEYHYYLRTGYDIKGLLDIHLVADEDIRNHEGYAAKIGAVTDAARPLPMGTKL